MPKQQQPKPKSVSARPARRSRVRRTTNKVEWNGTKFASKFERDFAQYLDKHGIAWEYEPDGLYWLPKPRVYKPDFKLSKSDGSTYYVETKGFFDADSRVKMACVKDQFPNEDIRMVFMDPNKKISKSKTSKTYSEWCDKAGYKWSSFCMPKEWREECVNERRTDPS